MLAFVGEKDASLPKFGISQGSCSGFLGRTGCQNNFLSEPQLRDCSQRQLEQGWSCPDKGRTQHQHLSVVYPWFIHRKMLLGRSEGIALFGIAPEMDPAAQRGHTGCNTPKTYLIISWELRDVEYKAPLQVSSSKGSRVGGFEIAHAAAPTTRTFVSWKLIPSSPKTQDFIHLR